MTVYIVKDDLKKCCIGFLLWMVTVPSSCCGHLACRDLKTKRVALTRLDLTNTPISLTREYTENPI